MKRSMRPHTFQRMINMRFRFRELTDEQIQAVIASPLTLPIYEQAVRDEMDRRLRETIASVVEPATQSELAIIDVEQP